MTLSDRTVYADAVSGDLIPLVEGWAWVCVRHQWADQRPTRALAKLIVCPLCAAEIEAEDGRELYAVLHDGS